MENFNGQNPMKEIKNSSLTLVKLKGTTKKISEHQTLCDDIIKILRTKIPDLNSLKRDISLIDNICLLIENYDGKTEIDKKQIATNVLISLFPELNNETDLDLISKNIDSVVDLSKNVVKMGNTSKFFLNAKKWFIKKLN